MRSYFSYWLSKSVGEYHDVMICWQTIYLNTRKIEMKFDLRLFPYFVNYIPRTAILYGQFKYFLSLDLALSPTSFSRNQQRENNKKIEFRQKLCRTLWSTASPAPAAESLLSWLPTLYKLYDTWTLVPLHFWLLDWVFCFFSFFFSKIVAV